MLCCGSSLLALPRPPPIDFKFQQQRLHACEGDSVRCRLSLELIAGGEACERNLVGGLQLVILLLSCSELLPELVACDMASCGRPPCHLKLHAELSGLELRLGPAAE